MGHAVETSWLIPATALSEIGHAGDSGDVRIRSVRSCFLVLEDEVDGEVSIHLS